MKLLFSIFRREQKGESIEYVWNDLVRKKRGDSVEQNLAFIKEL